MPSTFTLNLCILVQAQLANLASLFLIGYLTKRARITLETASVLAILVLLWGAFMFIVTPFILWFS
jgi:hypothetical protein